MILRTMRRNTKIQSSTSTSVLNVSAIFLSLCNFCLGFKKYYKAQSYKYHQKNCKKGNKELLDAGLGEEPNALDSKRIEREELKEIEKEIGAKVKEKLGQEVDQHIMEEIKCEHDKGCSQTFKDLKQYFKHHHYHFAYCRENKKYLKQEIRTTKGK